jgi:large subunit ribosomal protein L7/L12
VDINRLIDHFGEMTLAELSEFRHRFEEVFGVKAEQAIAVDLPPPPAEPPAEPEPEEFDVILTSTGVAKIQVIKAVRQLLPSLGLKDAKDKVDTLPAVLFTKVDLSTAQRAQQEIEKAGGAVTFQGVS